MPALQKITLEVLRYAVVGVLALVVDFSLLVILKDLVGAHYLAAAVFGFLAGTIVNYILSQAFVFESQSVADPRIRFLLFSLVGVVGLGLTEVIMFAGTDFLGCDYRAAKLVAVALVFAWNFSGRKFMLFRDVAVSA